MICSTVRSRACFKSLAYNLSYDSKVGTRVNFLTSEECQKYCVDFGLQTPMNDAWTAGLFCHSVRYPSEAHRYFVLSQVLSEHCWSPGSPFDQCLLWVENPMIWPSSNNLHLYYRLRQSYGDNRLIDQTPGHLFLRHEQSDLTSFIHIGMLFGWDMHVVPQRGDFRLSFSHHACVDIGVKDKQNFEVVVNDLDSFSPSTVA
jgi:hypothetical protein